MSEELVVLTYLLLLCLCIGWGKSYEFGASCQLINMKLDGNGDECSLQIRDFAMTLMTLIFLDGLAYSYLSIFLY